MVSYSDLFQFTSVILSAMTLAVLVITQVNNKKK